MNKFKNEKILYVTTTPISIMGRIGVSITRNIGKKLKNKILTNRHKNASQHDKNDNFFSGKYTDSDAWKIALGAGAITATSIAFRHIPLLSLNGRILFALGSLTLGAIGEGIMAWNSEKKFDKKDIDSNDIINKMPKQSIVSNIANNSSIKNTKNDIIVETVTDEMDTAENTQNNVWTASEASMICLDQNIELDKKSISCDKKTLKIKLKTIQQAILEADDIILNKPEYHKARLDILFDTLLITAKPKYLETEFDLYKELESQMNPITLVNLEKYNNHLIKIARKPKYYDIFQEIHKQVSNFQDDKLDESIVNIKNTIINVTKITNEIEKKQENIELANERRLENKRYLNQSENENIRLTFMDYHRKILRMTKNRSLNNEIITLREKILNEPENSQLRKDIDVERLKILKNHKYGDEILSIIRR